MEIHFYEKYSDVPADVNACYGWWDTVGAICDDEETIVTTQMGLLTTKLFQSGYRIFVHPEFEKPMYEIKLGSCGKTKRDIKMSHNLFKLWQAGEFSQMNTQGTLQYIVSIVANDTIC